MRPRSGSKYETITVVPGRVVAPFGNVKPSANLLLVQEVPRETNAASNSEASNSADDLKDARRFCSMLRMISIILN